MRKTIVYMLILIMLIFFRLSDITFASFTETSAGIQEGYESVSQNEHFEMFIEREQYNIAVKNKSSGDVFYSFIPDIEEIPDLSGPSRVAAQSQLIVSYIDRISRVQGSTNSLVSCIRKDGAKTEITDYGIKIYYDFPEARENFVIPVVYTLTKTGLSVRILFEEIVERSDTLITSISLLPYFDTAYAEDDGFIFIPDGSGAIVKINSGKPGMSAYKQPVYDKDPALTTVQKTWVNNPICMPVYGMKKGEKAFFAIITRGAPLATISAYPSNGESLLNFVHAEFAFREVDSVVMADATWASKEVSIYSKMTSETIDPGIDIYLLSGEAASLAGMAEVYHLYLGKQYDMQKSADKEVSFNAVIYGGVKKKKSFMGIPYDSIIPLTTFGQAESIIEHISAGGIDHQKIIFRGALKGGMDTAAPASADFERKLGGNKGFQELIDHSRNFENVVLIPDVEFQKIYQNRFGWWSYFFTAKNVSLAPIIDFRYKYSTYFKDLVKAPANIMSPSKLPKLTELFLADLEHFETEGLSTGSLGSFLSSDFNVKDFYDRQKSADNVSASLKKMKSEYDSIFVDKGFEYAAAYSTDVINAPVTDSGYDITYHSVPFYAMAFRGYIDLASSPINESSDYTKALLECIENGISPSFVFTWENTSKLGNTDYDNLLSTEFSVIFPKAAEIYERYCDAYGGINDQRIVDYEIVTDDVSITTLEGGKRIIVNYANQDFEIEDTIVPANDFAIIGGN